MQLETFEQTIDETKCKQKEDEQKSPSNHITNTNLTLQKKLRKSKSIEHTESSEISLESQKSTNMIISVKPEKGIEMLQTDEKMMKNLRILDQQIRKMSVNHYRKHHYVQCGNYLSRAHGNNHPGLVLQHAANSTTTTSTITTAANDAVNSTKNVAQLSIPETPMQMQVLEQKIVTETKTLTTRSTITSLPAETPVSLNVAPIQST
uniref:Uncharacterized protein n=1 Tax=Loa loa TaxID=7209 RepID=A0A1I7VIC9_LOALO